MSPIRPTRRGRPSRAVPSASSNWIGNLVGRAVFLLPALLAYAGAAIAWKVQDHVRAGLWCTMALALLAQAVLQRWRVFFACVGICGAVFIAILGLQIWEWAALRPVGQAVTAAVLPSIQSAKTPVEKFSVTGKILVWDVPKNGLSDVYYRLPGPLRATTSDQAMTVFLVWSTDSRQVGSYPGWGQSPEKAPVAFWDTVHLAVFTWPGPQFRGWHDVVGDFAPFSARSSAHGDTVKPIAEWIQSLPPVESSPPPAQR